MITNENNYMCERLNAPASAITVLNDGVYVAFCILKFNYDGKSFTEKSYKIFIGNSYRILYSSQATNVEFTAYCYTSFTTSKIICERKSQKSFTKRLLLEGTIFRPYCNEVNVLESPNGCCKCHFLYR